MGLLAVALLAEQFDVHVDKVGIGGVLRVPFVSVCLVSAFLTIHDDHVAMSS